MKKNNGESEQEFNETYPHEMEEWPYEVKFKVRERRTAKEIIKDVLRVIGNMLLGIGKVLLYGLIVAAGFVVLSIILILIDKYFGEKAFEIALFVIEAVVAIGSLVCLVITFRWLILWLKDLKENRKKKREISKCFAESKYMEGMMYYETGDDENSIKCFRIAAEQGHQEATQMYCLQYFRGVRENQDYGFESYMKMALMGIAEAQNEVGNYYANGISVVQNNKEALRWYRKAAKQGYAVSQCNVGIAYMEGKGVAQNYEAAAKWYRLSAEQGYAQAQNNLGYFYEKGMGVSQNYEEAIKWYNLAVEQGDMWAQSNLGAMYSNGQGVEQNYEEAVRLFRLAAEQGDVNSQNNLGNCYLEGKGVEKNIEEAAKWYLMPLTKAYIQCYDMMQIVKGDSIWEELYEQCMKKADELISMGMEKEVEKWKMDMWKQTHT